jgi:sugar phosphate isomerase/epimerase
MPFRFACSTNAYTRVRLPEAIRRIRALGFDGLEILADTPHLLPDWGDAEHAEVKSALDASDLAVSNVNANTAKYLDGLTPDAAGVGPTLIDPDPRRRGRRLGQILDAVVQTALLDGDAVCVCSGPRIPGQDDATSGRLLRISLEPVLALAEAKRIRVGIEYEPGFPIGDAASTRRLLDDMKSPWLGASLDIGHAVACGEDPAQTVEAFGDRIWNCHIEDIRGRVHRHPGSGEGDVDFGRIRRALEGIGYARHLTLALHTGADMPDESVRDSLRALRRIFG